MSFFTAVVWIGEESGWKLYRSERRQIAPFHTGFKSKLSHFLQSSKTQHPFAGT
jgi:hypothetical protein